MSEEGQPIDEFNKPLSVILKNIENIYLKNIIQNELESGTLTSKIDALPPEQQIILENIRQELNLPTKYDIIKIIQSGIQKQVSRKDREVLSKPLMKELEKLRNISYREEIFQFIKNCEESNKELYKIVCGSLESLWVKKYGKEEPFRRFEIYKNFEKILFKDPRYRDHFIHQFQVFLSGLPILEQFSAEIYHSYQNKFEDGSNINMEFSWLLAATFHDIGYIIQQFETGLKIFFNEFLVTKELPIDFDLGKLLQLRNFLEYVDKLTCLYRILHHSPNHEKWKYDGSHIIDYKIRGLFISKLIEKRNHGLISSLILLDRIENSEFVKEIHDYKNTIFSSIVVPAGLSIALHDKEIFSNIGESVDFSKDPLTFMLIYCDTLQEWGRPISSLTSDLSETPQLTEYHVKDDEVSATLTYSLINKIDERTTTFDRKRHEIETVLGKLKSTNTRFSITLRSLDERYDLADVTYTSRR